MRQFFKFLFASCLGTLVALFVLFFIIAGGIGALANKQQEAQPISANSVLHIKLDKAIPELMDNIQSNEFELNPNRLLGLHDITATIRQAAQDDDIKGIFLEPQALSAGYTTTSTIREAIEDFKAEGKFVYAYAPFYTQSAYHLSSVSDQIALAPLGIVDWRGFAAQYPFFKDMLDRIGVDFEVFFAGKYKSASEPYRRNEMSAESREQTKAFLDEMYRLMLEEVSASRNISTSALKTLANNYDGIKTETALSSGLVDQLVYREAFLNEIRNALGLEVDEDIKTVNLSTYHKARVKTENTASDKVAILIAEGTIVDGKGEPAQVGDKKYVKLIEDIRKDDDIKAVVLRVNSPGGSAMASDHIWQALMDLKNSGKKLVVSMGSVAASGGYYIAAPADKIYASPSTITGSIGVVSAIPQFQELLTQKMGVHFDSVKTGPFAGGINMMFDMSEGEKALLRNRTDNMYATFLSRVSEGRGMDIDLVDSLAQGRVWVGTTAHKIGLVDELGDLQDALEGVAELAELDDYQTVTYPTPEHPWERLAKDLMNPQDVLRTASLQSQLGSAYPYYQYFHEISECQGGMQMRLPFLINE